MSREIEIIVEKKHKELKRHFGERYVLVCFISFSMIVFGLTQNTPGEILSGMRRLIMTQDSLISDYILIGNMGSAFVNSGLLLFISAMILYFNKQNISGSAFAALFSIAGFGLFGKNLGNVWFSMIGVRLYAYYTGEPFSRYLIPALFSTAIAPVVSEIMYSQLGPLYFTVPMGILVAVCIGFLLAPIGSQMMNAHQGLSLSNMGFTIGLLSTLIISTLKTFGLTPTYKSLWSTGHNTTLAIFLVIIFLCTIAYGFYLNGRSFKGYGELLKFPGRLYTDFVTLTGKGVAFINMGIMGLIGMSFILLIGGDLNGPTVGSILYLFGFSAFGNHPKNTLPIMMGIVLISFTNTLSLQWPSVQIATILGSSLAPIAGEFGILWGLIAGALHASVVQYTGALHGGLNLYNNGFTAGIIATILAPIIEAFRKERL